MQEKNSNSLLGKGQADEAQIEQLIRLGGKRDDIDPACRERVRQHLLNVWSQQHDTSTDQPDTSTFADRKKITLGKKNLWQKPWALAAGILSLCLAVFFVGNTHNNKLVATITKAEGNSYSQDELLRIGNPIYAGQEINTADVMLELKWQDEGILKFDQQTRVQFIDRNEIRLLRGAIYFDSNHKSNVRILTSQGIISDIGTQFETRSEADDLSIYVREGKVQLRKSEDESLLVPSGKALHLHNGTTSIIDIDKSNKPWLWADAMDGSVNFDNHTMAETLSWLAKREHWQLAFKTEIDKQYAESEILHGQFNTANTQELLKQLQLISDMRYQITNNILMVSYP